MKSLASTTKYRVDVMATVWTHIFFGNNSECCGSSTESLKEEAGQEIIVDLNDNDLDVNTELQNMRRRHNQNKNGTWSIQEFHNDMGAAL